MNDHKTARCVHRLRWIGAALALAFLPGCGSGNNHDAALNNLPTRVAEAVRSHTPANAKLIAVNNAFGFRVLRELRKKDADKNLFLSPTSVGLALQIVYNGAKNQTERDMTTALGLSGDYANSLGLAGLTLDTLNAGNAAFQATLYSTDPHVQLVNANSLWVKEGDKIVTPAFIQTNRDFYGSEVGDVAGAPNNVNAWVEQKTQGKIKQLLPEQDYSQTVAIIVNAIYFKGLWKYPFDPKNTQDATFTQPDGTPKSCKMMRQSGKFGYVQGDGFQAIRLPYGENRLALYLFLPDAGTSLESLVEQFIPPSGGGVGTGVPTRFGTLGDWPSQMPVREGTLGLPRFRAEYRADLKDTLTTLGMGIAFEAGLADLSGIARDAYIQFVIHKTFVEVNEEGTEAAGATGIGIGVTGGVIPFNLQFNRPFLCVLRDDQTGANLFLGTVASP